MPKTIREQEVDAYLAGDTNLASSLALLDEGDEGRLLELQELSESLRLKIIEQQRTLKNGKPTS